MELRGKVALVTGASRGVGREIAIALGRSGSTVACAARATDENPLKLPGTVDETVRRIEAEGGRALAVPTNLAVSEEVERMVDRTAQELGRLDILVNNAAITFPGDLDIPMKRHDLVMEVNVRAPFIAMRSAIPHMKGAGEGRILNVSSIAAVRVAPGLMSYGVSKAALERLTVNAADELRPSRIAVNCFRIDVPVASEGFLYNAPDADHSSWEPVDAPAEGVVWMLEQPPSYTGVIENMTDLRAREGIMASRPGSS